MERANGEEKVGVSLLYKYDGKLFRRYVRNANMRVLTECLFADDGALLASSRGGAELAIRSYQETCSDFGLTVSNSKTKHMVAGRLAEAADREPLVIDGGQIENVKDFPYLGSMIADSGRMDIDVEKRIAQASRAFGALRKAVFLDRNTHATNKEEDIPGMCAVSTPTWSRVLGTSEKAYQQGPTPSTIDVLGLPWEYPTSSNRDERISMEEVRRRWRSRETVVYRDGEEKKTGMAGSCGKNA